MALFRTVMIGLICAGFTTVGYAVDNDDGVTGRYGDASGSKWDKSNPCTSKAGQTGVEHSGAIGDCKGPEGLTWTFKRCKNNLMRVIHADTRDLETAKLTVQNYCVKPKPCADGWDIVMAKVGNVHSVVFFPIFNSKGKPIDRERFCVIGKDFCNTTDAINAIEGAIAADMKVNSQAALQSQINGMTKEQLIAFFAQDFSQYAEYCCATKCRTPEYEEKPQGCKCVKKKADPKPEVKKYSIEYRCEDGNGCELCQPKEYTVGEKTIVVPRCEPTRDGYSHIGWYRNPSDEVAWSYVITETETANPVILHAKWQEIPQDATKYKIRYYLHADDAQPCQVGMPEEYVENVGVNITCQPTRNGFEFIGWCEGQDRETCENPEKSYLIGTDARGDKYMHAMWKKIDTTQSAGAICTTNGCSTGVDVFKSLENKLSRHFSDSSVWKDDEGKFNTARLASDSIAGVVLGTVGGVVTSVVMKKHQAKEGFEDLRCTINGQAVAEYGDEFYVGMTEIR